MCMTAGRLWDTGCWQQGVTADLSRPCRKAWHHNAGGPVQACKQACIPGHGGYPDPASSEPELMTMFTDGRASACMLPPHVEGPTCMQMGGCALHSARTASGTAHSPWCAGAC